MAIGPVQLLVIGFDNADFHDEIVAELERLRESDNGARDRRSGRSPGRQRGHGGRASELGAGAESAFKPIDDELEGRLAPNASMLVLVGETQTVDQFVTASGGTGGQLLRAPLTSEQAAELNKAAVPA